MHEMSLCEGILQIVEDTARANKARRVTMVRLEVGRFSGAEVSALRFCFDAVTRGTIAEGAALEIDETPGTALCFDCGETVTLAERLDPCPECGGGKLLAQGGDEMRIKDMQID